MTVEMRIKKILYQLAVVSLLTSLLWASISVYVALTSPADVNVSKATLEPFSPNIDLELMERISQREQLSSSSFESLSVGEESEPQEEDEEVQEEASPSATLSPESTPSSSATSSSETSP